MSIDRYRKHFDGLKSTYGKAIKGTWLLFFVEGAFLKIDVECESPKYAKGKYAFAKLENVFNFLVGIKGVPRGNVGSYLLTIAKDGHIDGIYTARYGFRIRSDFHDYALAQKVAKETGLIRSFDKVSPKLDIALAFAKAFDKEAGRH